MSLHRLDGMPDSHGENLFLRLQTVLEKIEKEQAKLAKMHDDLGKLRARSSGHNVHLKGLAPHSLVKGAGSSGSPNRTKVYGKSEQPSFYVSDKLGQTEVGRLSRGSNQQSALIFSLQKTADAIKEDIYQSLKLRSQRL